MRIKTLTLKNFRIFGEDHPPFDFADRMTVIAGINGRGKTAILDAIRILTSRLLPLISDAKGGYSLVSKYDVRRGSDNFTITLNCNCAGIPVNGFNVNFDVRELKIKRSTLNRYAREEIRKKYGDPDDPNDAGPLVVSYTTDRAAFRIPKTVPPKAIDPPQVAYRGALINRTVDYRDLAYRLKHIATADAYPQFPGLADRMQTAFHRVLEVFLEGFDNLRVIENPLGLLVDKRGTTFEVFQLSDGERSFLAMGTDLARRLTLANPGLEDPLLGAGVVLIDELELHLHPRWQRTAVEKLRTTFPNIQFIATTHSPFVIQTLKKEELILLDDDVIQGDFENRGLEEIAVSVLGIVNPEVSPKYLEMLDAAKNYFLALEQAKEPTPQQRGAMRRRLNDLSRKYANNPAYQALLELETLRKLGE
jgi:hypothetical protein